MTIYVHINVDFLESPSNMSVLSGVQTEAVFRCQHSTADGIVWRVNERPLREFPNITVGSISLVHTLTVPARTEYNGTEVVCVAVFLDESLPNEETLPAILTIIAGLIILQICQ